ncbi:MAG: hypothetical protein AABY22_33300 [Nanoarchaeota archaeon]
MNKKGEGNSNWIWIVAVLIVGVILFKGNLFSVITISKEASAGIGNLNSYKSQEIIQSPYEVDGAKLSFYYEFNGEYSKEQNIKIEVFNFKSNSWEILIDESSSGIDLSRIYLPGERGDILNKYGECIIKSGRKVCNIFEPNLLTIDYVKDNQIILNLELYTLTMNEEEQIAKQRNDWSAACSKEEQDWNNQEHRTGNFIPSDNCLTEPIFSASHGSGVKLNSINEEFYERGKYTLNTPLLICKNLRTEDSNKVCTSNLKEYGNKCIAVVAGVYGDKACFGSCPCPIIKYVNNVPQYQVDTVLIPSAEKSNFQWIWILAIIMTSILIYFGVKR